MAYDYGSSMKRTRFYPFVDAAIGHSHSHKPKKKWILVIQRQNNCSCR